MVNLRGAMRGLGASLAFIGQQGIAEQQREAADRRLLDREMAFATFQQGIRNEDLDTALDRDITKRKLEQPHRVSDIEAELSAREPFVERQEGRADERRIAAEDRAEERDIRGEERAFQTWRRRHGIEQASQRSYALWRREQGLDTSDRPVRYLEDDETGTYIAVDRDGVQTDTGIRYRRRAGEDEDDEDSVIGSVVRDSVQGAGRVAGTLRARTNSNPDRPPVPGARQAPDGNWYIERPRGSGRYFRVDR